MTTPAELSSLKSEVAALWKRFKKDEPPRLEDPARKTLVEQIRALDVKQKELLVRRDALRHEVEVERARVAGRKPVLRGIGLLAGLVVGVPTAIALAPALAEWTTRFVR
jgi:hypothetical protein